MSAFFWICVALIGVCFGLGALLIRHIFDESEEGARARGTPRYGVFSAPAVALAVIGIGTTGAWLAPLGSERPLLFLLSTAGGAVVFAAIGLPLLNYALSRRSG